MVLSVEWKADNLDIMITLWIFTSLKLERSDKNYAYTDIRLIIFIHAWRVVKDKTF